MQEQTSSSLFLGSHFIHSSVAGGMEVKRRYVAVTVTLTAPELYLSRRTGSGDRSMNPNTNTNGENDRMAPSGANGLPPEIVRAALERVLASRPFQQSETLR